ncbi:hypothetical protein F4553_000334 [Allocatelliglobosispora scoriae]|uniref:non-specific serine/threonine protein kinase n=1 Tax=Allocatelliglobosispora scoriae TaxID=643052 RepID=A0A841BH45_9ACTN|nr:COR domain-containing protein [Allocatelliglobosispora scoriae]MBB5866955.1 hypothetical protein [Allocatelliglobosispora scoriae]
MTLTRRQAAGLNARANPLAPEIQAAYLDGANELSDFLELLRDDGAVIREAKLVLVGEGDVGKSSLLAAMCREEWNEGRSSTHGVEIKSVTVQDDGEVPLVLNGWDFGGQPQYRSTHQLHFTAPAVYAVVWNPRRGPEVSKVDYWINLIKNRVGDSARIHVVATHAEHDDRGPWIDENALADRFGPMICGFHHIDSHTGQGVDGLVAAIAATANDLPHSRRRYPRTWSRLLKAFREGKDAYLTYHDYEVRAIAEGLTATGARSLARNANALGYWIHDDSDDEHSLVIFKPDWLSKAIGRAFEAPEANAHYGLISLERLSHAWTHPPRPDEDVYPPALHPVFRHLMQKFDISYQVTPSNPHQEPEVLITQLVPSRRPPLTAWTDYEPELSTMTRYCEVVEADTGNRFIPEGFVYQLIARFHRYSLGRDDHTASVHWQNGMVLDAGRYGRALITVSDQRITIAVRAAWPSYLLDRLTGDICDHLSFWRGLAVKVFLTCGGDCPGNRAGHGRFESQAVLNSKRQGVALTPCQTCSALRNVDELMHGVTAGMDPNVNRFAAAVAEILQPQFAQATDTINRHSSAIAAKVGEEADATRAAISQAEVGYRSLIRSLDEPARNGPRLMTIAPVGQRALRRRITTVTIRVTLWCEHSRLPLHVLDGNGTTGVYDIETPRKWLVNARPWLRATSFVLRTLLPVAIGELDIALDGDARWTSLAEHLKSAEKALEASTDIVGQTGPEAGRDQDLQRVSGPNAGPGEPDQALLRTLHQILGERDPSFAGMHRVQERERYLWVHRRFAGEYEYRES